jgi:hypothetical protein
MFLQFSVFIHILDSYTNGCPEQCRYDEYRNIIKQSIIALQIISSFISRCHHLLLIAYFLSKHNSRKRRSLLGFLIRIPPRYGCLCLVFVEFSQAEVSVTGRFLVQRSSTNGGVSNLMRFGKPDLEVPYRSTRTRDF